MMATRLLGLEGVDVDDVDTEDDGSATVYVQTAVAVRCPDCAKTASLAKERLACRLRDVPYGVRRMRVVWFKRRWYCTNEACGRGSFTESLADLPARRRLTSRLRAGCAAAVAGCGRTVAEAADAHAVSWHTAHDAFTEAVDPGLGAESGPVTHLGIDEVRRGRPRFTRDPATGETRQLADRWHTGFTDLTGQQGLLGHVEGRGTDDVISWLAQRTAQWRAGVQTVSIDMCTAFRAAARKSLPHATVSVDAVRTGASNAGSEGVNRIQKLDARAAFGYRNPENQRRRARTATHRSAQRSHTVTHRQRLWVTGPHHKPG